MTTTADAGMADADIKASVELLALTNDAFRDLVDLDIRGRSDEATFTALRSALVVDRWYMTLVGMKKSVEGTLAAKQNDRRIELKALRRKLANTGTAQAAEKVQAEIDGVEDRYLRWRGGALRFKTGVEQSLAEAAWRRRILVTGHAATLMREERDGLDERLRALVKAVRNHRDKRDDDEIDDLDEELYETLDVLLGVETDDDPAADDFEDWSEEQPGDYPAP